jgi:serine/threonine protein kinase
LRKLASVLREIGATRRSRPDPAGAYGAWRRVTKLRGGAQGEKYVVERSERSPNHGVMKLAEKDPDNEQEVSRLRREAETLEQLRHPCIVPLIEKGEDDERVWMVTEYAPFGSIQHNKELFRGDLPRVLRIVRDVASALTLAHQKRIQHRDVKPGNLLLRDVDHVQVADFGIAHDPDKTTLTGTMERVGPAWFAAPEAAAGRTDPDDTWDVYGLGKVLYFMLSGGERYAGDELGENDSLAMRFGREELALVDELVRKMAAREAARRLLSMKAVVAEIDRIGRDLSAGRPSLNRCGRCGIGVYVRTGYLNAGPMQILCRTDVDVTFTLNEKTDIYVCKKCGDMRFVVSNLAAEKLPIALSRDDTPSE